MPKPRPRSTAQQTTPVPRDVPPAAAALEAGLDEAGRGPILGPMVLACVVLDGRAEQALRALGVTDSKKFGAGLKAHAARAALVQHIHAHARHIERVVIEVAEIDARTRRGELNRLEQEVALGLLDRAPACSRIIADGKRIFAPLTRHYPQLRAEDKADKNSIAVAAASLIAKVHRDELWLQIQARYQAEFGELLTGFAGGGYLNEATRSFLRAYCARYRCIPPEGRASWPWDFAAELLAPETLTHGPRAPTLRGNLALPGIS